MGSARGYNRWAGAGGVGHSLCLRLKPCLGLRSAPSECSPARQDRVWSPFRAIVGATAALASTSAARFVFTAAARTRQNSVRDLVQEPAHRQGQYLFCRQTWSARASAPPSPPATFVAGDSMSHEGSEGRRQPCIDQWLMNAMEDDQHPSPPKTPKRAQESSNADGLASPPKISRQRQEDEGYEPTNRDLMMFLRSLQDSQNTTMKQLSTRLGDAEVRIARVEDATIARLDSVEAKLESMEL